MSSSLNPKKECSFREKYFFELLFLSAIGVIGILFLSAIAISNPSFYVQLGGI
jgi:hypothetical protein